MFCKCHLLTRHQIVRCVQRFTDILNSLLKCVLYFSTVRQLHVLPLPFQMGKREVVWTIIGVVGFFKSVTFRRFDVVMDTIFQETF